MVSPWWLMMVRLEYVGSHLGRLGASPFVTTPWRLVAQWISLWLCPGWATPTYIDPSIVGGSWTYIVIRCHHPQLFQNGDLHCSVSSSTVSNYIVADSDGYQYRQHLPRLFPNGNHQGNHQQLTVQSSPKLPNSCKSSIDLTNRVLSVGAP